MSPAAPRDAAGPARGVRIAPSILTADLGRLRDEIQSAEAGGAARFHLDMMDGHFVPELTFGALVVAAVARATALPLEVHMMVERPETQFGALADAGAELLIVHHEAVADPGAAIEEIGDLGCRAGLALNPATAAGAAEPWLDALAQVTVMLVEPGRGGQAMLTEHLDKVRTLRTAIDARRLDVRLEVDGGVKVHNAAACVAAGADVLVAGSAVYDGVHPPAENLARLRSALGDTSPR